MRLIFQSMFLCKTSSPLAILMLFWTLQPGLYDQLLPFSLHIRGFCISRCCNFLVLSLSCETRSATVKTANKTNKTFVRPTLPGWKLLSSAHTQTSTIIILLLYYIILYYYITHLFFLPVSALYLSYDSTFYTADTCINNFKNNTLDFFTQSSPPNPVCNTPHHTINNWHILNIIISLFWCLWQIF